MIPCETYYSVKRDLLQCQKRPITLSKETYYSVKRDLLYDDTTRAAARKKYTEVKEASYVLKSPTTYSYYDATRAASPSSADNLSKEQYVIGLFWHCNRSLLTM